MRAKSNSPSPAQRQVQVSAPKSKFLSVMGATISRTLEQILLSGYKSIRELKDFRLGSGLNVLIGANGSGKTNFIRFFELLGHLMDPNKGLQNYVSARGGADAFLFQGMKVTPEF